MSAELRERAVAMAEAAAELLEGPTEETDDLVIAFLDRAARFAMAVRAEYPGRDEALLGNAEILAYLRSRVGDWDLL